MRLYGEKTVNGQRLLWWKEPADQEYWRDHFFRQIETQHKLATRDNVKLVNILADHMPRDGRILEAGCGTGWIVAALQTRGFNIEGVDFSLELIQEVSRRFPNLPVRFGDVCNLDVPDGFYQGYVSLGVIEHRFEGPEPFLKEAHRILSPGSKLCISVPYFNILRNAKHLLGRYQSNKPECGFYQYGFTRQDFGQTLEECGFEVNHFEYYGTSRCLQEELQPFFDRLTHGRLLWRLPRLLDRLDSTGLFTHMIMAVAEKR